MILGVLGRVDDVDVCTQYPHTDRASDTTDKQKFSSTKLINKEEKPDKGHHSLNDTKDACHDVDSIMLNSNTL
jgi:hypothetical protein